jgi:hypothetical protein
VIVYSLTKDGKHGLIAAETDQATDIAWWNTKHPDTITFNYEVCSSEIDGRNNTENLSVQNKDSETFAALICKNYTGGGFNDWYLPSIRQLDTLYEYRGLLNLSGNMYWSSTSNYIHVWVKDFTKGSDGVDYVTSRHYVRAIRSF